MQMTHVPEYKARESVKKFDFMVFYFSGTGNSALVARQIAEGSEMKWSPSISV